MGIKEGYDTLQIVCECGKKGKLYIGDYYDGGFMMSTYKEQAIEDWNRLINALYGGFGFGYVIIPMNIKIRIWGIYGEKRGVKHDS